MQRRNLEYLTNIGITLTFAVLYGVLEYYWIITDRDVPFRYGHAPVFLGFQLYHIAIMLPILFLVGFAPFIDDWVGTSAVVEKRYTGALGFATTVFAIMLEDIVWFLSRLFNALPMDPLGGKWIQPSDWTARWHYVPILEGVMPTWYFTVALFAIVVWVAVFRHWSKQTIQELRARFHSR
jgi:hypothetical protein